MPKPLSASPPGLFTYTVMGALPSLASRPAAGRDRGRHLAVHRLGDQDDALLEQALGQELARRA
jgi:hypothetical protein